MPRQIDYSNTFRQINLGKIAYSSKRKVNDAIALVRLDERENKPVFTASLKIWNATHTDIVGSGQCFNLFRSYFSDNKLFQEIYDLWSKYHLNSLHSGTPEQEKALADAKKQNIDVSDYTKACDYLKTVNLYEVPYEGKNYKYGSGWIYFGIPDNDLDRILKLFVKEE